MARFRRLLTVVGMCGAGMALQSGVLSGPAAACTPAAGVNISPSGGTVPTNARVLFYGRSELLDAAHLHVAVAGSAVTGTLVTLSPGNFLAAGQPWVAFVPDSPFAPGSLVTASVSSAGVAGLTTSYSFTVGSGPDTTPPVAGAITGFTYSQGSMAPENRNFTLDIDPATDDSGFVYYHLILTTPTYSVDTTFSADGAAHLVVDDASSCTLNTPKNLETMHVELTAFDLAGNESAPVVVDETFADKGAAKKPGFACAVTGVGRARDGGGASASASAVAVLGAAVAVAVARRRRGA